ncbi:unnamed protein product [Mycena citricolor]|uniref:Zn(2)-C6 fungal-type domain-containing protein n=1 Tax=Mycena citricolor TaxID=2018698 RepID=A0AAD2HV15_9AGAR|nr:unnamed protein product [Mycena citricolor]
MSQTAQPNRYNAPNPGHQRNRIACTNCRRRKLKCAPTDKELRQPCERCAREGATCDFVTIPRDDPAPTREPIWTQPLDPASFSRGAQESWNHEPNQQQPSPYGANMNQQQQQYPYYPAQGANHNSPYVQREPASNFTPNDAPRIHYGQFPGPANTVYPWTAHQYYQSCGCPRNNCVCGRGEAGR